MLHVLSLKARLSVIAPKNPPPSEQLLTLRGKKMSETLSLSAYTLNESTGITLTVVTKLVVKSSSGSTSDLKICSSKNIQELKQEIQKKVVDPALEPCRQQLFFSTNDRCELLEDSRTIASYNLPDSPLIHLCE